MTRSASSRGPTAAAGHRHDRRGTKEAAMARTADRKFEIAKRVERARDRHGLLVEDIFIDPLVLPISTGMDNDRRSALELVEGTKRIAEAFPRCRRPAGWSNVSTGLENRRRDGAEARCCWRSSTQAGMTRRSCTRARSSRSTRSTMSTRMSRAPDLRPARRPAAARVCRRCDRRGLTRCRRDRSVQGCRRRRRLEGETRPT